ncbi:MAG: N,N-dimethylformamidase beta subunit family domain-containing protein [Bacteroidota bacterium]
MLILSGVGLSLLLAFVVHFYFLFSNSHQLFQWRHQLFEHLEFHMDHWTFEAGEKVNLYVSNSSKDTVRLKLYSPLRRDSMLVEEGFQASFQKVSQRPAVHGTNWQASFSFHLPNNISSGWYVIELSNQTFTKRSSIFIAPPPHSIQKEVAIIFSTNTWNAYNHWGGQSFYSRNHTPVISFDRPQLLADPFLDNTYPNHQFYFQGANRDLHLAELLDSAEIAFDAYSMTELEKGDPRLAQYSTLIFSTHTEYWSWNMLHHLNRCLDSGVSALFLAGNVAVYVTEFDSTFRQISIHPTRAKHSLFQIADTAGIRPFGTEYSYYGFQSYAPYQVQNDSSWVWEGVDVKEGDLLGEISEAYDYTPMYDHWWQNLWGLRKRGQYGAASGLEIDKVYPGTPDNWVHLASGLNPLDANGQGAVYPDPSYNWQVGNGADMGYYLHPGGGIVFHASSMAFTGALPHDGRLRKLVINLIRK